MNIPQMNSTNTKIAYLNDEFSELELQLFHMGINYPANKQNTISVLRAKHAEVKVELIESVEAVDEALTESKRSGDIDWYIAKYRIINDYASDLVIEFKKEFERARPAFQLAS